MIQSRPDFLVPQGQFCAHFRSVVGQIFARPLRVQNYGGTLKLLTIAQSDIKTHTSFLNSSSGFVKVQYMGYPHQLHTELESRD